MRVVRIAWGVAVGLIGLSSSGQAQEATGEAGRVVSAVAAFHAALAAGDSLAALELLAADAQVLESGTTETLAEYRAHHLPADIAFAQAVPSERRILRVVVVDSIAWLTATSHAQGTYRGRSVNSDGAELMVLVRSADRWRIRAIHWSSRSRRQP
jgi:ketosteroid isomerase-like protein